MNLDNTLAAVKELAAIPEYPLTRPRYELLEEFYQTRHGERDHLWREIKGDSSLLLLFVSLPVPTLGGEIKDVPLLKGLLAEILSSESELPDLKQRAVRLLDYLKREGLVNGV